MWMNEVYRNHRENLAQKVKEAIAETHNFERFEELAEKKEVIRKVVNIIHQTEFNLVNNAEFLSISMSD